MWKKPEEIPELFPEYYWHRSKEVPVIVEGREGWEKGYYHKGKDGYQEWHVVGFNGDYKILAWFDLPESELSKPETYRQTKVN